MKTIKCPICGKIFESSDKSRKTCSWGCRNKRIGQMYKGKTFTEEHKKHIRDNHHNVLGSKNPNWKGGKMLWNLLIRSRKEFKEWRHCVYERDSYTCVRCGCSKSGTLTADHLKPLIIYPELAFDISNGQTLCKNCHYKKNSEDRKLYFIGKAWIRL